MFSTRFTQPPSSPANDPAASATGVSNLGWSWPITASSGWLPSKDTDNIGVGVNVGLCKKIGFVFSFPIGIPLSRRASRLVCWRCAIFLAWYKLPRLLLQAEHAATRLSALLLPPRSSSIRWSAVVAGLPHHAQGGWSASRRLRLRWYSGSQYALIGPDALRLS